MVNLKHQGKCANIVRHMINVGWSLKRTMNDKFFELKKEKQDRMINAALKVFALQGYKHASTDDIVKEAGISKGLLFHYFESKLGVYEFIYEYSVRYMVLELGTMVSRSETNLFEVMKQVEFARMNAMREYPHMQQFLNRAMSEDVGEVLLATEEKRSILEEEYNRIKSQIRFTGFPTGVDGRKLQKMMDFTIKGLLTERFMENSFQPEMFYEEVVEYLDMMKTLAAK